LRGRDAGHFGREQSSDNFAASGSVALRHVAHRWFVENDTLGLQVGLPERHYA
jgi:hypothetical protein